MMTRKVEATGKYPRGWFRLTLWFKCPNGTDFEIERQLVQKKLAIYVEVFTINWVIDHTKNPGSNGTEFDKVDRSSIQGCLSVPS